MLLLAWLAVQHDDGLAFRDKDPLADLADASSFFANLERPTTTKWESYWRRNPIRAITTATRGEAPWFEEIDGRRGPRVAVDEHLGETLDAPMSTRTTRPTSKQ